MLKCAYCGSSSTQAMADRAQCLNCGKFTNYDGSEGQAGLQWTSDVPASTEAHARRTAWAVHDQRGDEMADDGDTYVTMEHKLEGTEGKTKPLTVKQQADDPNADQQIPDKAVNKTMGKDAAVQYDERGEPLKYHEKDEREALKDLAENPPDEADDGPGVQAQEGQGDEYTSTETLGAKKGKR